MTNTSQLRNIKVRFLTPDWRSLIILVKPSSYFKIYFLFATFLQISSDKCFLVWTSALNVTQHFIYIFFFLKKMKCNWTTHLAGATLLRWAMGPHTDSQSQRVTSPTYELLSNTSDPNELYFPWDMLKMFKVSLPHPLSS